MGTPPQSPLAQDTRGRPQDFGLDVRRLRRVRLIVFVILALPILLLALLTMKFVSLPITQATHQSAYEDGNYTGAIERLAPVQLANWFEPYLPHLSEGTDLLQMGQNAEAEAELRAILPGGARRESMLRDFDRLREMMGREGVSDRLAADMVAALRTQKTSGKR